MKNKIVYDGRTFEATDIKSGQIHLAASLPSMKLEPNTFTAVVKSEDKSLTEFTRNTPLYYYYRERLVCISYVQTVDRIGPNKYKFYGTSAIGRLIEQPHAGGIYTGQTAEEVITDICGPVPFEIKNVLKKIKLYGWLPYANPPKRSARDNLVQVLFAIGAAIRTDLDGVLRIEGLWDGISGQVPQDNMYADASVDYSARITQVIVTEHQYVPWTEEKQLFEGTAQAGDVITFDEPMHSLTAQGFTIQASGANWARVSAGSGTLTGKTYIHNTRQVSKAVQEANTPNVKTVEDATLVSLVNSSAIVQRLAEYYKCRETVDSAVVYQGESPGDRLAIYHPFDKTGVAACLESADITLSNTLKAQEKLLVGYEPPQTGDVEYFDYREIITQDCEWEPPEGVTEITVVCIGGGFGGWSGQRGGNTEKCVSINMDNSSYWTARRISGFFASVGGKGGVSGQGGQGGRITQGSLTVSHEQKIIARIGRGGSGGVYSASGTVQGSEGTPSIFGDITSASGSPNPAGYTDIITGEKFAVPGIAGVNGGNGSGGIEQAPSSWTIDPNKIFIPGSIVRGPDGRTWSPARLPASGEVDWNGDSVYNNGYQLLVEGCFGLSGGAAVGSNGSNGSSFTNWSVYLNGTTLRGRGTAARGGKGANAVAPSKKSGNIGAGGDGGHGGGGAGGSGQVSIYQETSKDATTGSFDTSASGEKNSAGPGNGSNGGQGGDGCIIVYYRMPKKVPAGQLVDKNNRMVLDRLGRRIIM